MTNWRILNTYIYPHDAHMAKSYLESYGIKILLKDELTAQVNNFYSNAIGGVKILIQNEEYDQGIELLKQGGFVVSENDYEKRNIEIVTITNITDKSECPFCSSRNIGRNKEPNILTMLMIFLLGAFFPIFRRSYVCFDCSKEWKFTKETL